MGNFHRPVFPFIKFRLLGICCCNATAVYLNCYRHYQIYRNLRYFYLLSYFLQLPTAGSMIAELTSFSAPPVPRRMATVGGAASSAARTATRPATALPPHRVKAIADKDASSAARTAIRPATALPPRRVRVRGAKAASSAVKTAISLESVLPHLEVLCFFSLPSCPRKLRFRPVEVKLINRCIVGF